MGRIPLPACADPAGPVASIRLGHFPVTRLGHAPDSGGPSVPHPAGPNAVTRAGRILLHSAGPSSLHPGGPSFCTKLGRISLSRLGRVTLNRLGRFRRPGSVGPAPQHRSLDGGILRPGPNHRYTGEAGIYRSRPALKPLYRVNHTSARHTGFTCRVSRRSASRTACRIVSQASIQDSSETSVRHRHIQISTTASQ